MSRKRESPDLMKLQSLGYVKLAKPKRLPCGHMSHISTKDGERCVECETRRRREERRLKAT